VAAEAGVDVGSLQGTAAGRIIKRDIEAALVQAPAASRTGVPQRARSLALVAAREAGPESLEVELSTVRRTIARRLVQSKGPVPHFYLTVDVAMDRVWDAYKALRDQKSTISINDVIVKAAALALRQH
jgi:pyruvate dehydrogenase E2 component (dihydrolipoamide acetyltransferase)